MGCGAAKPQIDEKAIVVWINIKFFELNSTGKEGRSEKGKESGESFRRGEK